jgi:malonyl-CoA O-methyltransferase
VRSKSSLDKNKIAASFSRSAERYDEFAGIQKRLAKDLVGSIPSVRPAPSDILDIGSGTGSVAFLLADKFKGSKVVGCDIALGMVRKAINNNRYPNVNFEVADAEALPYPDASFDLVASSTTYQWVNDLPKAFAEAKRVLKPGGYFAFITFGPKTLTELKRYYRDAFKAETEYLHDYPNMREVVVMLKSKGFEVVKNNSDTVKEFYADFRAFFRSLKGLGALNAAENLPKGLRARSKMNELIRLYDKNSRIGKQVYATYEIVKIVCRKPS